MEPNEGFVTSNKKVLSEVAGQGTTQFVAKLHSQESFNITFVENIKIY